MWIETNRVALREFRIRDGYSQRKLAEKVGCSGVLISQIESGERNPSPRTAKRIAEVLGVQFKAIFKICALEEEKIFDVDDRNRGQSINKSNTKAS